MFQRDTPVQQPEMQRAQNSSSNNDEARRPAGSRRRKLGSFVGIPILSSALCLGLLLFLLASTIILSLIPTYLPQQSVAPATLQETVLSKLVLQSRALSLTQTFNANQRALLQAAMNVDLAKSTSTSGTVVTVLSVVGSGSANSLRAILLVKFGRLGAKHRLNVLSVIEIYVISTTLEAALEKLATPTTTTTAITTTLTTQTTTNSSSNSSRTLARRSIVDGGAPHGITYIDTHRLASINGLVSSVSFYADQSCDQATVEFGAFELITRNVDKNTAELVITQKSGPLRVSDLPQFRSSMNLVTIQLCDEQKPTKDCQGKQFHILPHQYVGVRSDSCRLGYADPPTNRLFATTWIPENDNINPFDKNHPQVKYVPSDYIVLQTVTIDQMDGTDGTIIKEKSEASESKRVLFMGSFPPRRCGLASFLEDLTNSYQDPHAVVAVDEPTADAEKREYPEKVVFRLPANSREQYYQLAEYVNEQPFDVVNMQHEYALYGGMMGEYILAFMALVRKPIITTLHTIVPQPDPMVMSVTRALCSLSKQVVVMTEWGRKTLIDLYGVDEKKIVVIPHGVPDVASSHSTEIAKSKLGLDPKVPIISTFGLLHRNKNIELGLKALKKVTETVPDVKYWIIGQTHPTVQMHEGESYRNELVEMVNKFGLTRNVEFIDRFLNNPELIDMLSASDIYLTPYAREDQYVSGTLSWAVGLGKAVVSTPYIYAKELLSDGRGFVVPFNDMESMSSVLSTVLENNLVRQQIGQRAYAFGRNVTWGEVSQKMSELFAKLA